MSILALISVNINPKGWSYEIFYHTNAFLRIYRCYNMKKICILTIFTSFMSFLKKFIFFAFFNFFPFLQFQVPYYSFLSISQKLVKIETWEWSRSIRLAFSHSNMSSSIEKKYYLIF